MTRKITVVTEEFVKEHVMKAFTHLLTAFNERVTRLEKLDGKESAARESKLREDLATFKRTIQDGLKHAGESLAESNRRRDAVTAAIRDKVDLLGVKVDRMLAGESPAAVAASPPVKVWRLRWLDEAQSAMLMRGFDLRLKVDGDEGYEGWGALLFTRTTEPKRWAVFSWTYGSCSGCDPLEELERDEIVRQMADEIRVFNTLLKAEECFSSSKGW